MDKEREARLQAEHNKLLNNPLALVPQSAQWNRLKVLSQQLNYEPQKLVTHATYNKAKNKVKALELELSAVTDNSAELKAVKVELAKAKGKITALEGKLEKAKAAASK